MKLIIPGRSRGFNKNRASSIILALIIQVGLLGGCGNWVSSAKNSIDDVISAIEATTKTISQESSGWRDELPKLLDQLNGMESNITADAKGILADTTSQLTELTTQAIQLSDAKAQDLVAQAGVEFRCDSGFVKEGAIAQLQSIVEDLKFWKVNKRHQEKKPNHTVCWINPSALSLYPSGNNWLIDTSNMSDKYIVHIFGYNFWPENLPIVEVQNAANIKIQDIRARPTYVTHYQLNLNLSSESFTTTEPDLRIVFRWPDKPDPNSISLVPLQPASLRITNITWSKSSPIATQDQVWPIVTITNLGGVASEPFELVWKPMPNAADVLSTSFNRALGAGESTEIQPRPFSYQVCGSFTTNISLSNGSDSRNETITIAPFCPAVEPPTPFPEKQFGEYTDSAQSFGPGGFARYDEFGTICDDGYHRSRPPIVSASVSGSAGCYFADWTEDNEHMCRAKIRIWVDGFSGVDCSILIMEIGNPLPTPMPPPSCSCRP